MNRASRRNAILLAVAALLAGIAVRVATSPKRTVTEDRTGGAVATPVAADYAMAAGDAGLAAPPATRTDVDMPASPLPKPDVDVEAPVAGGDLRVILRVPGGRDKDGARVLVTVLRDGEPRMTLFWWSDRRGFHFQPTSATPLGPRAKAIEQVARRSAEESSVLLSDLDGGEYDLLARLDPGTRDSASQAVVHATVERDRGAIARIELPSTQGMGEMKVRILRGGKPATATVGLVFQSLTLESINVVDAAGATVSAPAGVDLDVQVTAFAGSREFGFPPPQTVRLAPGQTTAVVFELPAGTEVNVRAASPSQTPAAFSLSMWRLPEGGEPRYVENALAVEDGQTRWTGRLPPGRYAVYAATPSADGFETLDVVASSPTELTIPLRAYTGRVLRTRWVEAGGAPASGLRFVLVREAPGALKDSFFFHAVTDPDGRATLPPLSEGTYGAWFWDRKLYRRIDVTADRSVELESALPPLTSTGRAAALRGTLQGPAGERVAATVLVERDGTDWCVLSDTDGGGSFKFAGLGSGDVRIRVPHSWFSRTPFRPYVQNLRLFVDQDNVVDIALRAP